MIIEIEANNFCPDNCPFFRGRSTTTYTFERSRKGNTMSQDIVYDRTMTVEEAIDILNSAELYGPVYEATQVIIKVLSEQSLRHGHWIKVINKEDYDTPCEEWHCSICHQHDGWYDDIFCKICGAIMNEEVE